MLQAGKLVPEIEAPAGPSQTLHLTEAANSLPIGSGRER
jgi:hypothetical protein